MFYRASSTLSQIFNWTLKHIYCKTVYLLRSLKSDWMDNGTLDHFALVCQQAGSHYARVEGFVDGTGRGICRPMYMQSLVYSGYKKKHVTKYQSVVYPNGLIGRLDGPFNWHRHDAAILALSRMREEMARELQLNHDNYALYGDPGYSNQKFITVGYKNHKKLTKNQKFCNRDMSGRQVSVEYGFGKIVQRFAFLDYKKNQKMYLQHLKEQYFVAAMLVNVRTV